MWALSATGCSGDLFVGGLVRRLGNKLVVGAGPVWAGACRESEGLSGAGRARMR